MANNLTFDQIATVLNAIVNQATGQSAAAPVNTADFITQATTALKSGYDPLNTAISQVLERTIFSVRPYYEKFQGLRVDERQWGGMARKLNVVDKAFVNDDRYTLTDGSTVDQYIVRKPEVLQTNFYGGDTVSDYITVTTSQLDVAFRGPDELAEFWDMTLQNVADRHAQARESIARACVANFVGGIIASASTSQIIHLLSEYNAQTGLSLTATTVYQPANFAPFMKWAYARIAQASAMLTERSVKYHRNVTGKEIRRHSPYDRQKVFLYAPAQYQIEAEVLADTYHDNYIRYAANETVNYWQSIDSPDTIEVIPSYLAADGTITTAQSAVNQSNIFGVILDEESAGYVVKNEHLWSTPLNARGGYYNYWWHFDRRYWNDMTENGIVILMD